MAQNQAGSKFTSITLQGMIVGPVLLRFFINHLDGGAECCYSKFTYYTKPGGVTVTSEGCAATERDLGRLENWAERNLIRLNSGKREVLHWNKNNSRHQYILRLENSLGRKALGVSGSKKLIIYQQYVLMMKRPTASWAAIARPLPACERK